MLFGGIADDESIIGQCDDRRDHGAFMAGRNDARSSVVHVGKGEFVVPRSIPTMRAIEIRRSLRQDR